MCFRDSLSTGYGVPVGKDYPSELAKHIDAPSSIQEKAVILLLKKLGEVNTTHIEPGSPWENGYIEYFNARLRDEFLNGEIFYTLLEAQIMLDRWRIHYNTVRPYSALNGRPPAAETIVHRKDFTTQ